jgi:hypothetical protein
MENSSAVGWIIGQHDAQYRYEQEQKRKHCYKHCVRELDSEVSRVVVTELLHYAEDERWNYVTLLKAVNAAQSSFDSVHVDP